MKKTNGMMSYPFLTSLRPMDNGMKISNKYKGKGSIVLINLPEGHDLEGPYKNNRELESAIDYSKNIFGDEFKILYTYHNVNRSALGTLRNVVHALDAGKKVNIESALR